MTVLPLYGKINNNNNNNKTNTILLQNQELLKWCCNERIGKMLHNICISAVAISLRWESAWASCYYPKQKLSNMKLNIFLLLFLFILLAFSSISDQLYDIQFSNLVYTSSLRENQALSYEGPAKSFVTGFGLLQCYVLSNIFLLQTFKVFPLYWNTIFVTFYPVAKSR